MTDLAILQAEAAAGMYKKPVEGIARAIHYEPLPAEVVRSSLRRGCVGDCYPKQLSRRLCQPKTTERPMFGWLRSKPGKPRELTFDVITDIMEKYGELLETYPTAYVDESRLPVPKEEMRRALQAAWKTAPQLREAIEIGWSSLHRFQPKIGRTPIDVNPDTSTMFNRFVKISKVAQPEMERDFEEMSTFKRANS